MELSNNDFFFLQFRLLDNVNIIFSSGEKKNDVFREVVFKYKHIAALFAYLDKKYASRQQQSGKKVVKYFVKLALCRVCVCTRKSSMRSFILEKLIGYNEISFQNTKACVKTYPNSTYYFIQRNSLQSYQMYIFSANALYY